MEPSARSAPKCEGDAFSQLAMVRHGGVVHADLGELKPVAHTRPELGLVLGDPRAVRAPDFGGLNYRRNVSLHSVIGGNVDFPLLSVKATSESVRSTSPNVSGIASSLASWKTRMTPSVESTPTNLVASLEDRRRPNAAATSPCAPCRVSRSSPRPSSRVRAKRRP